MSGFKKIFISGFILFQFLTMVRVHLPLDKSRYLSAVFRPVDSYLSFFSIYQDWMMFAPNPSRTEAFVSARVEFEDGTSDTFNFERTDAPSLWHKYMKGERYRKFMSETLRKDDYRYLWPDTARFVLRKVREQNLQRIPMRVHLYRHWDEIPLLEDEFRPHGYQSTQYQSYKFYTYEVI